MKKNKKEVFKSLLLVILLLTSLFQVGFLWSGINEGLTIPFVANIESGAPESKVKSYSPEFNISDFASVILNPYRVTICDGGQQSQKTQRSHFLVPRKSALFTTVKERVLSLLYDIAANPPEYLLPVGDWGDLISERGALVEFRTPIPLEIVAWLSERGVLAQDAPSEINKLLIVPDEHEGRQSVCLYALTNDRIVRTISQSANYYDMLKMINEGLATLGGDISSPRYMTINEFGGGRFPNFAPDVFCVVEGPKTGEFKHIRYTAPMDVRDQSELENIILANDIYSYNRSIDYNDTLVFKNVTSIYRLYKSGYMEYNYIPLTQAADKGGVAAAMENAAAYILNIERQLLGGADLVLSGVYPNESDLTYRFTFDYVIEDFPVYFRYNNVSDSDGFQNAINIAATANRTVSCRWMLVDLFFSSNTRQMYTYFDQIDVDQSLTEMSVTDIAVAYTIDLKEADAGVDFAGGANDGWPVWAMTAPDRSVQAVNMGGE